MSPVSFSCLFLRVLKTEVKRLSYGNLQKGFRDRLLLSRLYQNEKRNKGEKLSRRHIKESPACFGIILGEHGVYGVIL